MLIFKTNSFYLSCIEFLHGNDGKVKKPIYEFSQYLGCVFFLSEQM